METNLEIFDIDQIIRRHCAVFELASTRNIFRFFQKLQSYKIRNSLRWCRSKWTVIDQNGWSAMLKTGRSVKIDNTKIESGRVKTAKNEPSAKVERKSGPVKNTKTGRSAKTIGSQI